MNEIVPISECDLGDEVIVGLYSGGVWHVDQPLTLPKNAFIIGKYKAGDNFCVGWNGVAGFGLHKGYFNQWECSPDPYNYTWVPNWKERFEFVSWLYPTIKVMRVEKRVLHKDQKCGVCALPAPHAPPNKDGVYVCDVCIIKASL